jgi:uncharacterized protein YqjF (DUF2071 family)
MLSFLKNHPFAVEAFFEQTMVLTFSVPKEDLQRFIPPCLELDTFDDRWAFIAMAMVRTRGLRPRGFPEFMGNDFFLTGYRIFVRYTNHAGKRLRGLYILKSETDKKKMELLGNIFTHYNYATTDIGQSANGTGLITRSIQSDFEIGTVAVKMDAVELPAGSPFNNWKEARRFAGPLPFTFSFNPQTKEVLIIEGVREHWQPDPVKVTNWHVSFLDSLGLTEIRLASAFAIQNIPYYWKKGKIEKWKG